MEMGYQRRYIDDFGNEYVPRVNGYTFLWCEPDQVTWAYTPLA